MMFFNVDDDLGDKTLIKGQHMHNVYIKDERTAKTSVHVLNFYQFRKKINFRIYVVFISKWTGRLI